MSTVPFSPYVAFPMNAAEMLHYYQSVFGGEVSLMEYTPEVIEAMGMPVPEGAIAHGQLTGGDVTISGGDAIFGETPDLRNHAYSFMLQPGSLERATELVERLVNDGGEQPMPFDRAPWGAHYGQVIDKYGVLWHFNVD
jgi:PhnB protein